jgi:hypothetical protein
MSRSREARLGVLAAIALALLPGALALWIHAGRGRTAQASVRSTHIPARLRQPHAQLTPRQIAKDVELIRQLSFKQVPPIKLVGPAEVKRLQKRQVAKAKRKLAEQGKSLQGLRRASRATLEFTKLAGVVSPSFQAKDTRQALLGSIAGEFDPSAKTVRVITTPGEPYDQRSTVIAHELDHSLDNAYFPDVFKAVEGTNSERQLAVSALVEGAATVVAARFDRAHDLHAAVAGGALLSPQNGGYGVPPALAAEFRFPYTSGAHFVSYLYSRAGSWRLVNRAFRHPPTSTAQILNPNLWINGQGYANVRVAPALGAPLKLADQAISGQLDDELVLALALPARTARSASRGWDGGAIAVWRRPEGKRCAAPCRSDNAGVLADRWRSVPAAARFLAKLPTYLTVRLDAKPAGAGIFKVGDGYAAVALHGHGTAMSFAPSAAKAERIANGAATNADQAR